MYHDYKKNNPHWHREKWNKWTYGDYRDCKYGEYRSIIMIIWSSNCLCLFLLNYKRKTETETCRIQSLEKKWEDAKRR